MDMGVAVSIQYIDEPVEAGRSKAIRDLERLIRHNPDIFDEETVEAKGGSWKMCVAGLVASFAAGFAMAALIFGT